MAEPIEDPFPRDLYGRRKTPAPPLAKPVDVEEVLKQQEERDKFRNSVWDAVGKDFGQALKRVDVVEKRGEFHSMSLVVLIVLAVCALGLGIYNFVAFGDVKSFTEATSKVVGSLKSEVHGLDVKLAAKMDRTEGEVLSAKIESKMDSAVSDKLMSEFRLSIASKADQKMLEQLEKKANQIRRDSAAADARLRRQVGKLSKKYDLDAENWRSRLTRLEKDHHPLEKKAIEPKPKSVPELKPDLQLKKGPVIM